MPESGTHGADDEDGGSGEHDVGEEGYYWTRSVSDMREVER